MTREEWFDIEIINDNFRKRVGEARFENSRLPPCAERMIVEGRLAEALYFSERMMEKMQEKYSKERTEELLKEMIK